MAASFGDPFEGDASFAVEACLRVFALRGGRCEFVAREGGDATHLTKTLEHALIGGIARRFGDERTCLRRAATHQIEWRHVRIRTRTHEVGVTRRVRKPASILTGTGSSCGERR